MVEFRIYQSNILTWYFILFKYDLVMPPCLQKPSLKHDYVLFRVNSLCPFCTDAPPRTAGAFCFFCPSNILSRHCTLCLCYHAGHLYANDITSNVLSYHPLLSVGTTSRTINQWAKMQHTLFIATRINVHYDIIPSVRVGFLFEQQDGSFCGRRRCCVCVLVPTKKTPEAVYILYLIKRVLD